MANQNGKLYGFTGLFPIKGGEAEELRAYLRSMDSDPNGSPLYRVRCIHLARFVLVDHLPVEEYPAAYDTLRSAYLLVMCDFDGTSVAAVTEDLVRKAPDVVEAIWSHCRGCPSTNDAARLGDYFTTCQLKTNLFLADQPGATVSSILSALELQRRFTDFVREHQGKPPGELQAAFERFTTEMNTMEAPLAGMVSESERMTCLGQN